MTTKAEKLLLVSLEERWKNYRVQLKTCRREFSEEAVHDLRIAARRLLAVLDIVRALDPHSHVQKARKALKNQLDSLDDLRDFQVMLVDVEVSLYGRDRLSYFACIPRVIPPADARLSKYDAGYSRSRCFAQHLGRLCGIKCFFL